MSYEHNPAQAAPRPMYNAPTKTNGFAVTAMVLGIVGVSLLAVIFGHVSLGQIKRNPNESGRGMALAGVILGYVGMALYVILIIAAVSVANDLQDYPCTGYSGCYE